MTFDVLGGIPEVKSVVRSRSAVEDILERGRVFFRKDVDVRGRIGLPLALHDALDYAGPNGFIASMPELIAAKVAVAVPTGDRPYDRSHWLWKEGFFACSEENVGPNYTRQFYPEEEHLVVVVHGGGLLSPDRILRACAERLFQFGGARYTPEEFRGLLRGQLPDGEVPLFSYDEIAGQDLPRRCGIVLPYSRLERAPSCMFLSKRAFLEHPLVIARNAGVQHLEDYFERGQELGLLGNWHPFNQVNPNVPQGRMLFLDGNHYGLRGDIELNVCGHFVGVRR